MSIENEGAPEIQEQEEISEQTEETVIIEDPEEESTESEEVADETVSLSKTEFNKLKRKAIAYDSHKVGNVPKQRSEETTIVTKEQLERLELRQDGYSKEEVDEIMSLGGSKVLNSKLIQSAIRAMRDDKKSKDASERPNSKSPVYKKYTQEDLSKMTSAEMEKILSEQ